MCVSSVLGALCNIIRIRLRQQSHTVHDPAEPKQSGGEQVEDAHADAALVEFMGTIEAQK